MATVIDQEAPSPVGVATTSAVTANSVSVAVQDVALPSSVSPPSERRKLDLLLTSGQRKIWDFPVTQTVYAVKEEVWNKWPSEWDERPTHPSALRLLYMGHFLDDSTLLPSQASTTSSDARATVVHLIIRPGWAPGGDNAGDDDSLKKHNRRDNAVGGCRCVIC